jgi:hypothetical protein
LRITIAQLKKGCILFEDILSATKKPLVDKKTIVNQRIIDALNAFLINEAEVERLLANEELFEPAYQLQNRP